MLVLETGHLKSLLSRCSRNQVIVFWDCCTVLRLYPVVGLLPASLFTHRLMSYPSLLFFFFHHRLVFSFLSPYPDHKSHQDFGLLEKNKTKKMGNLWTTSNFLRTTFYFLSGEKKFPCVKEEESPTVYNNEGEIPRFKKKN